MKVGSSKKNVKNDFSKLRSFMFKLNMAPLNYLRSGTYIHTVFTYIIIKSVHKKVMNVFCLAFSLHSHLTWYKNNISCFINPWRKCSFKKEIETFKYIDSGLNVIITSITRSFHIFMLWQSGWQRVIFRPLCHNIEMWKLLVIRVVIKLKRVFKEECTAKVKKFQFIYSATPG